MGEKPSTSKQEWLLTSAERAEQTQRLLHDYLKELSHSTKVRAAVNKAFLVDPSGNKDNSPDREIRFRGQFNLWGLRYVVKPSGEKPTDIVVKLSLTRRGDKEAYITREEWEEISIEISQDCRGNVIDAIIMHKDCARDSEIVNGKYVHQEKVTRNTNSVITLVDRFLNQFRTDVKRG